VIMLVFLINYVLKYTSFVVTRYFGGIKLGAGGLIRAYGSTTSEAIRQTGVVQRQLMQGYSITVEYPLQGQLENSLRNSEHILETINYSDKVEFIVYVKDSAEDSFKNWIIDITSDQAVIKETDKAYIEIDVEA